MHNRPMFSRDARRPFSFSTSACVLWLLASPAAAQTAPRPEDVQAAGRAFQEAQSAQLRGDHAQAAELYDLAHRTAPSAAAMRSAVRMHQTAGHHARAANLANDAIHLYASDAATVTLANEVLTSLRPRLGLLHVVCTPECTLAVDGRALGSGTSERSELFVTPGTHWVLASWESQIVEQSVEVALGAPVELALTRPELPALPVQEPEPLVVATAPVAAPPPLVDESSTGLSPIFFGAAAGLTVLSGGFAIGLGVDMLGARDAYVRTPTESGWRDGVQRELRTNALIGTSIGLAALTLGLAFLTDWDGDSPRSQAQRGRPRFTANVSPEGAYTELTLSF